MGGNPNFCRSVPVRAVALASLRLLGWPDGKRSSRLCRVLRPVARAGAGKRTSTIGGISNNTKLSNVGAAKISGASCTPTSGRPRIPAIERLSERRAARRNAPSQYYATNFTALAKAVAAVEQRTARWPGGPSRSDRGSRARPHSTSQISGRRTMERSGSGSGHRAHRANE
jgi:hypothetical protein